MQRQLLICLEKMKLGNNNTKEQMEKKFGQDYHKLFLQREKCLRSYPMIIRRGLWFHIMMRQKN